MSIPAAAGYQRYSGHPLVSPIHSRIALKRFHEQSIIPQITHGDFLGELPEYGGTLVFRLPPRAIVRASTLGGTIQHDQYSSGFRSITVGKAYESSHLIDHLDEMMMSGQWGSFVSEITESVMEQYDQSMQKELLNTLPYRIQTEGDPSMFGKNAGKVSRAYDLGEVGTPVAITSANIVTYMTYVKGVARESNLPVDAEGMFIIMPSIAEVLILNSELRDASFRGNGAETMLVSGKPLLTLAGISIFINNNCPMVYDNAVNAIAYQCLFGFKWAIASAMNMIENRIIRESPNSWLSYHQTRVVAAQGILYPNALGILYARFA